MPGLHRKHFVLDTGIPEVFANVNSAQSPRFLSGEWVDLYRFQTRFVIGWENNRDGDITMPLSLKTIGSAGYRTNEIGGLDGCRSIAFLKATRRFRNNRGGR